MSTKTFKISTSQLSELRKIIPKDNIFHKVLILDQNKRIYVKNKNGKLYTKKVIYSELNKITHIELKSLLNSSKQNKQKLIHSYTVDFLKNLCPDFPELRHMIDADMIENLEVGATQGTTQGTTQGVRLEEKISDESKIKKLWIPNIKKSRLIKGFMQSKKTWAIVSMSLYYYLVYKMPVFIIIENKINACDQMIRRVKEVFSDYMKSSDFENVVQILDIKRGKKSNDDEVKNAMMGKNPKIFISMRSEYDLHPVNQIINSSELKRFVIIIDESDANDTLSDSSAQEELTKLKEMASLIWSVTATALTTLLKEDIESGNVFIMRKPEGYKDLPTFNMIKLKKDARYCDGVNDNPFEKDANLQKYIKDFSDTKIFNVSFWGEQLHPVISLIRIGTTIEPQLKVARYIQEMYNNRITTITYNGTGYGTTIRGKNLPKTAITSNIKSTYSDRVHTFSDVQIGDVISYLQENGGVEKFPRVVILAGKMADRGITFGSSNYSKCMEMKCLPWHLTEMYYLVADTTDQRNLLQTPGRLCGVYMDNIPLTLYSNACEDIIKAYHMQEELISRSRKLSTSLYMRELIPNVPISREKCSKRRVTPVNIPCKLKKVKDDKGFGGWDWKREGRTGGMTSSSFGKGKRPDAEHKVLSEDEIRQIREEKREEDVGTYKKSGNNWRKILFEKLPENDKKLYRQFVDVFTDEKKGIGLGKKCEKSSVIKMFDRENLALILNKTWHWHCDNSKYWKEADETDEGLLFCLEKNTWNIRVN